MSARNDAGRSERPLPVWVAALALVLALLFAGLCAAVPAYADEGGSVEIGVNVKGGQEAGAQGGSVELAVNVGVKDAPAPAGNSVDLSVNVAPRPVHRVSFVGYYCDEEGNVVLNDDGTQKKETIEAQDVLHGGRATAPENLARTYKTDSGDKAEYWVDGWYRYDGTGALVPVDLSSYGVEGGTTFVCYWKRGYAIKLDPNNGSDASTGAAVFDGAVDGAATGTIAAARDLAWEDAHPTPDPSGGTGNPTGFTPPAFPAAERAGYTFQGWYWADEDAPRDRYGRVVLDEAGGPVAEAGDSAQYDFFRQHCASGIPTLYAKWELTPDLVRIALDGANTSTGDAELWFWTGRGYTTQRPAADKEAEDGFVITEQGVPDSGLDLTSRLNVAYNPAPPISNQVFAGWGYQVTGEGGKLERIELVSAAKAQGGSDFAYTLSPKAFDYVSPQGAFTGQTEPDSSNPDNRGGRKAVWQALFDSARISVTAPFEVVFQKKGDAWSESNPDDVKAYTADEIDGATGWTWIESIEQKFTNRSTAGDASSPVEVYVSGIDCVNTGAKALIPARDGASDLSVFALYSESLAGGGMGTNASLSDGTPGMRSVLFGYAIDGGNTDSVTVSANDPSKWIVLEPAGEADKANTLYFGLDLTKVALDRSAIAMGGSGASGASSYKAQLANVKYTYSVVP